MIIEMINNCLETNNIPVSELSRRTGIPLDYLNSILAGNIPPNKKVLEKISAIINSNKPNDPAMDPNQRIMNELMSIIVSLPPDSRRELLEYARGLMLRETFPIVTDREDAIRKLNLADIPISEANIEDYLEESPRYINAMRNKTVSAEYFPMIDKVKKALRRGHKPPEV